MQSKHYHEPWFSTALVHGAKLWEDNHGNGEYAQLLLLRECCTTKSPDVRKDWLC